MHLGVIVFFLHLKIVLKKMMLYSRAIMLKPGFEIPMDTSEQIVKAQKVRLKKSLIIHYLNII